MGRSRREGGGSGPGKEHYRDARMSSLSLQQQQLLPLLLFPIQVPVILATVKSTGAAIRVPGLDPPDVAQWLGLLVAFDALFLALSVLLFDHAIEE